MQLTLRMPVIKYLSLSFTKRSHYSSLLNNGIRYFDRVKFQRGIDYSPQFPVIALNNIVDVLTLPVLQARRVFILPSLTSTVHGHIWGVMRIDGTGDLHSVSRCLRSSLATKKRYAALVLATVPLIAIR